MRVNSVKFNTDYKQIHFRDNNSSNDNTNTNTNTVSLPIQGNDITQFQAVTSGNSNVKSKISKVLNKLFAPTSFKYDPRNSSIPSIRAFLY